MASTRRRAVQPRAEPQSAADVSCPECGAALDSGGACRDLFHDLLVLEAQVPGAPGADARRRARAATNGAVRVRRRDDAPLPDAERAVREAWPRVWSITVRDVAAVPPDRYVEQVRAWAGAVCAALDGLTVPATPPRTGRRPRGGGGR